MMKPLRATTLSCLLAALPFGALACDGIALEKTTLYNAPFCFDQPPQRMIALDASFTLGIGMDVGLSIVGAPLTRMGDHDLKAVRKRQTSPILVLSRSLASNALLLCSPMSSWGSSAIRGLRKVSTRCCHRSRPPCWKPIQIGAPIIARLRNLANPAPTSTRIWLL